MSIEDKNKWCFKPCYKWITFNTIIEHQEEEPVYQLF